MVDRPENRRWFNSKYLRYGLRALPFVLLGLLAFEHLRLAKRVALIDAAAGTAAQDIVRDMHDRFTAVDADLSTQRLAVTKTRGEFAALVAQLTQLQSRVVSATDDMALLQGEVTKSGVVSETRLNEVTNRFNQLLTVLQNIQMRLKVHEDYLSVAVAATAQQAGPDVISEMTTLQTVDAPQPRSPRAAPAPNQPVTPQPIPNSIK